jgi:ATP-dependent RNA helicase DeaD
MYKLRDIQRYAKVEIKRGQVPSLKDVEKVKINQFFDKVRNILDTEDTTKYANMIEHLIGDDHTSLEVAGALLKMVLHQQQQQAAPVKPAAEQVFGDTGASRGMVRLFINVGRQQQVKPGDILGAISGETGMDSGLIGEIDVHTAFTFAEVPAENAAQVISIMNKRQIKGNRITVSPAQNK